MREVNQMSRTKHVNFFFHKIHLVFFQHFLTVTTGLVITQSFPLTMTSVNTTWKIRQFLFITYRLFILDMCCELSSLLLKSLASVNGTFSFNPLALLKDFGRTLAQTWSHELLVSYWINFKSFNLIVALDMEVIWTWSHNGIVQHNNRMQKTT